MSSSPPPDRPLQRCKLPGTHPCEPADLPSLAENPGFGTETHAHGGVLSSPGLGTEVNCYHARKGSRQFRPFLDAFYRCHKHPCRLDHLPCRPGPPTNRLRTTTPQGSFAKLQPQSKEFYEISDHRAVLENSLRHFSCLTEGDNFSVNYNNKVW